MALGLDQTTESTGVVEYAAATSAPLPSRLRSCTRLLEFQPSPSPWGGRFGSRARSDSDGPAVYRMVSIPPASHLGSIRNPGYQKRLRFSKPGNHQDGLAGPSPPWSLSRPGRFLGGCFQVSGHTAPATPALPFSAGHRGTRSAPTPRQFHPAAGPVSFTPMVRSSAEVDTSTTSGLHRTA